MSMATRLDHRTAQVKAETVQLGSSREQLLDAAARVFAKRGYSGASINEIAAEAGFSKGALYWNFASKEELFFALLDERIDQRIRALIEETDTLPAEHQVGHRASRELAAVFEQERDLVLLFHEYSAMAARDPRLRAKYVERNDMLRAGLMRAFADRELPPGVSGSDIATAVIALADGLSIELLTNPNAVRKDLFGEILTLIFDGLKYRTGES
jgi:AcrR family transcriptional regulator